MKAERLRPAGIGALVLGLVATLFLTCFERRTLEIPTGWSREALGNRYLAAQRLFEGMGHEVVTLQGPAALDVLPPKDATLVFPRARRTLTPERSRALLDWAEGGGHLVVVTYTLWDDPRRKPDHLLDPLGLRQFQYEFEDDDEEADGGAAGVALEPDATLPGAESDEEPAQDGSEGREAEEAEPEIIEIFQDEDEPAVWDECQAWWPGRDEPLRVNFDWRFYWVDTWGDQAWHVTCDWGTHLVTLRRGYGWITALTDEFFLRNGNIGELDHAELAVRLARMGDRRGPVWIVLGEEWPGLWSQAREHAAPALTSLALLALAWIWRASRRFGPLHPAPAPDRRRWLEHLEAVGRHHWREDRGAFLLGSTRARVEQLFQQRHPVWSRLPPPERFARVAEISGLSPEEVAHALDEHFHPVGEAGFVSTVTHLERIRASL